MLSLSGVIIKSLSLVTYQFSPVFVSSLWPFWALGLMRSSTLFLSAGGNFISGKVLDRFKAFSVLVNQFVISRIILITAFLFPTVFSPIFITSSAFLFSIGQVAQRTLFQKEFTDYQRATMGSIDSLLTRITMSILLVFVGILADLIGRRNMLLLGEILVIPVIIIYWRLSLHNKKIA